MVVGGLCFELQDAADRQLWWGGTDRILDFKNDSVYRSISTDLNAIVNKSVL